MIGKLCVLLGFHKYIVYYDVQENCNTRSDVEDLHWVGLLV